MTHESGNCERPHSVGKHQERIEVIKNLQN
jgi:hypothetical protein